MERALALEGKASLDDLKRDRGEEPERTPFSDR